MAKLKISIFLAVLVFLPTAALSQVGSTTPIRSGATLPAVCAPGTNSGGLFFKTTAPVGTHQCTATNTWARILGETNFANEEGPAGAIDGVNVTFTLNNAPSPAASLMLKLNGVTQRSGAGNDYTLSGTTITFANPPTAGDSLVSWYQF